MDQSTAQHQGLGTALRVRPSFLPAQNAAHSRALANKGMHQSTLATHHLRDRLACTKALRHTVPTEAGGDVHITPHLADERCAVRGEAEHAGPLRLHLRTSATRLE
eukprot:CAMPEP_0183376314 /NCGR_PEP_ID=MMETSP0164_2-20130417/119923_1 /TAXON_ID=221442 /ORGANISM="Coccolithus pelagicus ssp braarudi, Strain PLY182g" /LENGTH=105 /DNA_ID=CAMNT_0025553601 /DNA_START=175 /DNA_END=489 /DNA_ORIENTATION=+